MKKVIIITGSIIVCVAAILIGMFTMMLSGNSGGAGKPDLVFSTPDATAVYNGQALTATEWNLETGTLKKGHIAEGRVTGIQTEAGTSKNKMSVSIVNGKGKDVSGEYSINTKEGTLTVTPIKIEVIAKSTQKIYDGMPLKCDSFDVLSGSLLEGHNFTPTYFGEQTTV